MAKPPRGVVGVTDLPATNSKEVKKKDDNPTNKRSGEKEVRF